MGVHKYLMRPLTLGREAGPYVLYSGVGYPTAGVSGDLARRRTCLRIMHGEHKYLAGSVQRTDMNHLVKGT